MGHVYYESELCHYGVKGMKWGIRKEEYRAMNKQQRKAQREKYRRTPAGKIERATTIGTILGGPLVGAVAGSITAKKLGVMTLRDVPETWETKGRDYVAKALYTPLDEE